MSIGTVQRWVDDEGWGVVASLETPGGCWFIWSQIDAPAPHHLDQGQLVEFTFESSRQDGFNWRAVSVRPSDAEAGRQLQPGTPRAFKSTFSLEFPGTTTESG